MKTKLSIRKAILERKTYEPPAEGREGKIRLDFNENTAGCSPAVLRALSKLTSKQLAMYPEVLKGTAKLARHFGVAPDELVLTNGGDDALRVFFDAFVDGGSSILICEPTFPMYRYYAEIYGAKIDVCRYDAEMRIPLEDILKTLRKRPRVFFLANPNNPTGTLVPLPDLRRILETAPQTAIVFDEAYAEFSGLTTIPWIRRYPNLFVARTFSKAAGLASLRLGAVIARKDSLELVRRAMPPYPVNLAALVSAVAAVRDKRRLREHVREVLKTLTWFAEQLKKMGVKTFPSSGNFLLANFGPGGPALFAYLEKKDILLRERTKTIGPGFVRIGIGTRKEMETLLREIRRYGGKR
ncbi:MAG TPA: histidinol-phosphate transaminase [Candidatus Dormibacteraeota bacterium]|jgi:histidinol-phosphate aminotransferase|nr:histidinol-phosphate transaminase [Candidatus Dormibacteraeota bacterium]